MTRQPIPCAPRRVVVIGAAGGLGRGILRVCRAEKSNSLRLFARGLSTSSTCRVGRAWQQCRPSTDRAAVSSLLMRWVDFLWLKKTLLPGKRARYHEQARSYSHHIGSSLMLFAARDARRGSHEKKFIVRNHNSGWHVLHTSERFGAVSENQNSETEADAYRRGAAGAER